MTYIYLFIYFYYNNHNHNNKFILGNSSNKNDVIAGSYRPSVHPSQTMSYEIKVIFIYNDNKKNIRNNRIYLTKTYDFFYTYSRNLG